MNDLYARLESQRLDVSLEDVIVRRPDRKGCFSVRSSFEPQNLREEETTPLWEGFIPPRLSFYDCKA